MQTQAGTIRYAGMSDQPKDPLGETARTCSTMDIAASQLGDRQKIVEKLISAKVSVMPARANIQRRARLLVVWVCSRRGARRLG